MNNVKIIEKYKIKYVLLVISFILILYYIIVNLYSNLYENKEHFFNSNKKKYYVSNTLHNGNKLKYTKCKYLKLNENLKIIFDKYNFNRIEDDDDNYNNNINNINNNNKENWDIYLPCGYNYIETELNNIKISNNNQAIFGIKGCDRIASKNDLWKIISDYYGRDLASELMPESFIINNPDDIKLFKKKYNENNLYLLKKNIQRKRGILITNNYNKIINIVKSINYNIMNNYYNNYFDKTNLHKFNNYFKNNYKTLNLKKIKDKDIDIEVKTEEDLTKNQKLNTLINNYKIIQLYINNLYLIKNRKVNLRLYILISCKENNKQFYLYNYGKCIYTNKDYNEDNSSKNNLSKIDNEEHLTSLNLDQSIYETHPESLEELEKFMGKKYYFKLWNNIYIMFRKIIKAIEPKVCYNKRLQKVLTFQLFGTDVIFTNDLHPYLLEFNKGPSMKFLSEKDKEMKLQLTEDTFKRVGLIKENKIKINIFNNVIETPDNEKFNFTLIE